MDVETGCDDAESGRPIGRRVFLGTMGLGLSSLLWGDAAWRAVGDATAPLARVVPAAVRDALPAPSDGWRIYAVNPPFPEFDPSTWRLTVTGLVAEPASLSLDDVKRLPRTEQVSDFHCVTGWSVPDVRWTGVRISDLLARVAPEARARALSFVSLEEPYVDTLTLRQALLPDVMLAYAMDGRPLTREHGAPVRVVMPKMYGYKGVKWLARIDVTDVVAPGYWEQRGYDSDAWVGRSNGYS